MGDALISEIETLAKEYLSGLDDRHEDENHLTPKRSAEIELRDFIEWLKVRS